MEKILIIDDDPVNNRVLKGFLNQLGYEVVSSENGFDAIKILDHTFDLIFSDVMMPLINGFELVEKIRSNPVTCDIPVIMVTTLNDRGDRLRAVKAGANDFINKPVDAVELQVRTESMLRQKSQQDEIKSFSNELNLMVESRTLDLNNALIDLDTSNRETIQHLSVAAEYKDEDTASHIQRMALYSSLIASSSGLDTTTVDLILTSSPMHDIGKMGIPDNILLKPGKLDTDEWRIMRGHTIIGGKILAGGHSDYMKMGTLIALSHHEKWDGSGYPSGIAGEAIPMPGRICAVADVFDALTTKRPYKGAFSVDRSIEIMKEGRGSHFDPNLLDIFLEHLDEVVDIKEAYQGA